MRAISSLNHECGLIGVYSKNARKLSPQVYYGLFALQHRGQESAGIAISYNNKIDYYKDLGLVSEVFDKEKLSLLPEGNIAIGHVRYSNSKSTKIENAQPILYTGNFGRMAIGINGHLINHKKLTEKLIEEGVIFQTDTDCEIIAGLINKYTEDKDIVKGVRNACEDLRGGFAFTLCTTDKLIAVRDRNGLLPLVIGKYNDDYFIASETCAIDAIGGEVVRDVKPGEIIVIDKNGVKSYFMSDINKATCIFEMVYIARSDSTIDTCSVYNSRFNAGVKLAEKFKIDADVVAGAPDSGVIAGRGYAFGSKLPYIDLLSKNRYIGRTFIQPEQVIREKSVKIKLNAIKTNIEGKRIILVDDSIVRGTTCRKTVEMIKQAGAKEVHLVVASPPVMHPCFYGVDMTDYDQLIASNHSNKEMCRIIGADSINYIEIDELVKCCSDTDTGYCTACFTGDYPIKEEV